MSAPPAEPALVVPTGHLLGPYHPVGGQPPEAVQVQLGATRWDLSPAQFVVWGLAHGSTGAPVTRPQLYDDARRQGVKDPPAGWAWLQERGLLAEVTPGTPGAQDFARSYRLIPLMLGLGNTAQRPETFLVGTADQPVVALTEAAYFLFAWGMLERSLWRACEVAAGAIAHRGGPETEPAAMLAEFLRGVHFLLAPGAICLEAGLERR